MISSNASKLAIRVLRQKTPTPSFAIASTARSFVSATSPLFEQRKCKVPTMGDSITEGTIVEWTAQIGQAVKEGDVVALVETDKVTVDIKAEIDGVITAQFAAV
jgi:biotin carboxyl carrier protein